MKNDNLSTSIKDVKKNIMAELFQDVDTQQCVMDVLLKNSKKLDFLKDKLCSTSLVFFNNCKEQLKKEMDRGKILFFRKYEYEKILNNYIKNAYNIETLELEMFPSEKKQKELEREQKLEKIRKEEEAKQIEYQKFEKKIINHADQFKWKKTINVLSTTYMTENVNYKVEYSVRITAKKKLTGELIINNTSVNSELYDAEELFEKIKFTKPKIQKKEGMIVVVNKDWKNTYDEDKKKRKQKAEERAKRIAAYRKTIELEEQKENEKKREEKKRLQEQIKKEKEKRKKEEERRKKELQKLPLIGIKDFIVRRDVFKCMHANHHVENIDAAVKIINHKDEEQLIRISAGYCEECNIYFILESTYQNLKKKGIILCRVTDEKNYKKYFYANGMQLAQESILMQFGYNVSQTEGLSEIRRQKILAVMMDYEILSRTEIISYLDFFIRQREGQNKFQLAVSKWEMDREFVESYRLGEYTKIGVNCIFRN